MQFSIPASIVLLLQAVAAAPAELVERQAGCNAVQIFLARGTDEPYPGRQSAIVSAVCSGMTSCGYTDIGYPAAGTNYCASVQAGKVNGTALITAYAARCPNVKIVLSGYSQGAEVVGDILGGGGGTFSGCTQPTTAGISTTTSPGTRIRAAALFGDVRHVASQSYNTDTGAARNGIFPRTGTLLTSLNRFSAVLRSWCHIGDPVCAQGTNINDHLTYFTVNTQDAATWIRSKLV